MKLISRYIFQHTHSSRMPPASVSPTMASSCMVTAGERMRRTTAPAMPQKITRARMLRRDPGGRETDDDGIVAGQHDVDDDDLYECDRAPA